MSGTVQDEQQEPRIWWLYLLACADGRTYAGIAIDVDARFRLHANGQGARFTRANPPVRILGAQPFPSRSLALKAEYALKQLRPAGKIAWAKQWRRSAGKRGHSRKRSAGGSPDVDLTDESVHSLPPPPRISRSTR